MPHPPFGNPPLSVTKKIAFPYKTHQVHLHGFQSFWNLFASRRLQHIKKWLELIFQDQLVTWGRWSVVTLHFKIYNPAPESPPAY